MARHHKSPTEPELESRSTAPTLASPSANGEKTFKKTRFFHRRKEKKKTLEKQQEKRKEEKVEDSLSLPAQAHAILRPTYLLPLSGSPRGTIPSHVWCKHNGHPAPILSRHGNISSRAGRLGPQRVEVSRVIFRGLHGIAVAGEGGIDEGLDAGVPPWLGA